MRQAKVDRQQAERTGRIAAVAWLFYTSHRLLARRYSAAGGEVDLVVRRGRVIIFCEVIYWRPAGHDGVPSPAQQRRVCNAARKFIARHHISPDLECRFDLIRNSPFTWRESLLLQHLRDV